MAQARGIGRIVHEPRPCARRRIEAVQSAPVRADPQHAGSGFADPADQIMARAVRIIRVVAEYREPVRVAVVSVQPVVGPDPQISRPCLVDRVDRVVAQARGIRVVVQVELETLRHRIVSIQSAVKGAEPDISVPVLADGENLVVAQAVRIVGIVADDPAPVSVVHVHAVFGADPDEAALILDDAFDDALRKPLFDGNLVEPDISAALGGAERRRGGGEQQNAGNGSGEAGSASGRRSVSMFHSRPSSGRSAPPTSSARASRSCRGSCRRAIRQPPPERPSRGAAGASSPAPRPF